MKPFYIFINIEFIMMFVISAIVWEAIKFEPIMVMGFFSLICLTMSTIYMLDDWNERTKEKRKNKE